MDKEKFLSLVDGAGYSVMDYSGRGMYGKKCVAVDLDGDSVAKFVSAVWLNFIESANFCQHETVKRNGDNWVCASCSQDFAPYNPNDLIAWA